MKGTVGKKFLVTAAAARRPADTHIEGGGTTHKPAHLKLRAESVNDEVASHAVHSTCSTN